MSGCRASRGAGPWRRRGALGLAAGALLWQGVAAGAESLPDDWAFRPLAAGTPPAGGSGHPVDAFLDARRRAAGVATAGEADRVTWLRRVCFQLTGLPPTVEQVEAFGRDGRPGAEERVVDALLASPHYGERWARHWLDVVRFGESQGFEYDRIRDHAWRYRDYVIRAFNRDTPYDQFIREQVAGDVLAPVTSEGIVATGFLVAGPWDQAGNGAASPTIRALAREAELEDMVGTVGQTFLGITLNCARCHDHKFDPLPQADYYRVKAVFQGVRHGDRVVEGEAERRAREAEQARRQARLAELEGRLAALEREMHRRVGRRGGGVLPDPDWTGAGLLARWSFEEGGADGLGRIPLRLEGAARVAGGQLRLEGRDSFAVSAPLPFEVREKTLEAWVSLDTLDQGGGGVITLEKEGGGIFDSLVYGERQARKWMAGSEGFRRTRDLPGDPETAGPGEWIHLAVTYSADRTITVYRQGRPVAPGYPVGEDAGGLVTYPAGSRLLLGRRHTGGGRAFWSGSIAEARLYHRALTPGEVRGSFAAGPDARRMPRETLLATLSDAERRQRDAWEAEAAALGRPPRADADPPRAYAANPEKPGPTSILLRGEPGQPRGEVGPGALTRVAGLPGDLGLPPGADEAERRRRFAAWLTRRDNPLTARTVVNRVWHHHFGRGLVATPNDLGRMGTRPTHPELLDWLAAWFVAPDGADWSLKRLHRLLVTSAAYRRASEAPPGGGDPDNRYLGRFPLRRLEAEAVRDALLVAGGEWNPAMGGPGFRPFLHRGNGGQNEYFAADLPGEATARRTVYRMGVHSARDPLLDSLDCPEFSTRTASRASTTTPLQALSLMNNPLVQRMAAGLAREASAGAGGSLEAAVRALWRRALARDPRPDELVDAVTLARARGLAPVAWAVLNSSEFLHVR